MNDDVKTCPTCGKKFTKKSIQKKIPISKHLIDRSFKRRRFCSQECNQKYYSREQHRKKYDSILKIGKCQVCSYHEFIDILEIHHIIERCNQGTDDENNLILLCPNCHRKAHKQHITPDELYKFCVEKKLIEVSP